MIRRHPGWIVARSGDRGRTVQPAGAASDTVSLVSEFSASHLRHGAASSGPSVAGGVSGSAARDDVVGASWYMGGILESLRSLQDSLAAEVRARQQLEHRVAELEAEQEFAGAIDAGSPGIDAWLRDNRQFMRKHRGEYVAYDEEAHEVVASGSDYGDVLARARDARPGVRLFIDLIPDFG